MMLIPADKTTNLYEVSVDNYPKLLKDNFTTAYQKADISALSKINTEAQSIANELKLDARVESFSKRNAFITLKDHEENFQNYSKCRLINPAKSEIGKISKQHLDSINTEIPKKSGLNQWKNTVSTLSWFNNTPSKADCKFLKFDIVDFYPSISEKLLTDAIEYAKKFVKIDKKIIETIMHCRKSLLFCEREAWSKKSYDRFDVTMGSYDGAEVCELVGLYLLHHLSGILGKEAVGLYHDDGLAILRNTPGPNAERLKTQSCNGYQLSKHRLPRRNPRPEFRKILALSET